MRNSHTHTQFLRAASCFGVSRRVLNGFDRCHHVIQCLHRLKAASVIVHVILNVCAHLVMPEKIFTTLTSPRQFLLKVGTYLNRPYLQHTFQYTIMDYPCLKQHNSTTLSTPPNLNMRFPNCIGVMLSSDRKVR